MSSAAAPSQRNAGTAPTVLGPYQILDVIGGGGMGVVYRARHVHSGDVVAVKTVRVPEERMLASIRREIHALSRMRHQGVVRVLDQGYDAGLPWFAMELLKGHTLAHELRSVWRTHLNATLRTMTALSVDRYPLSLPSLDYLPKTSFDRAIATLATSPMAASGVFETRQVHTAHSTEQDAVAAPFIGQVSDGLGMEDASFNASAAELRPRAAPGAQEKLLQMLLDIAGTLAVLHGVGVVHRDLKTENIFLREGSNTPVLVDFGLAVPGARGREILRVGGTLEGTLPYTSPEQLLGEFVDARADLYSFGCVFYECLTGRPPFVSDSIAELVHMHLYRKPLPPSEWTDGISPEIDELVLSLLQKDPRKRIGYASDLQVQLELVISKDSKSQPASAAGVHALYRAGFAGRTSEMKVLERRRASLLEGRGGLHLVSGPTGIGKTRLLMEFMRWTRRDEVMMVAGQSSGLGLHDKPGLRIQAAPLHPLRELFLAVLDAYQERSASDISKILGNDLKVLAKFEPLLLTLPGAELSDEPAELSAEAAQQRVIDALKRMLAALAEEKPVLLVLDDVQWADELTLRFLASISDTEFASCPVLVIAACRDTDLPEDLISLIEKKSTEHTVLSELGTDDLVSVIGDMLAVETPHPALLQHLSTLPSSGNPFFVSEILHVAWERSVLRRTIAGDWEFRVDPQAGGEPLPRSVDETSKCRLSMLKPAVRNVLEVASVWGRVIDIERLCGLEDLKQADIMDALEELVVHGLVQSEPTGEIGFVHDGVYRVAYQELSENRRRALHAEIAQRLEQEEQHERNLPLLAHHYVEAKIASKAFYYLMKNARNTLRSGAHRQAMALLVRAEHLMMENNAEGFIPSQAERISHGLLMAETAFGLGKVDTVLARAGEVLSLHGCSLPKGGAGWVVKLLSAMTRQLTGLSRRKARALQSDAIRLMHSDCAEALNWLSQSYVTLADPLRILCSCFMMANEAEAAGEYGNPSFAYSIIGATVGTAGMNKKAIAYFERAHDVARERRSLRDRVYVAVPEISFYLGAAMWDRFDAAVAELEPIAKHIGAKTEWEAITMLNSTHRLRRFGADGTKELISQSIKSAMGRANPLSGAWGKLILAQCYLICEQYDELYEVTEEIYPILLKGSGPAAGATAKSIAAHADFRLGKRKQAKESALEALRALKGEMLMFMHEPGCRLVAELLLDLAEAEAMAGKDPGEERQAAKAACKMLESLARRYPLARAAAIRMWARFYRIEKKASRSRQLLEKAIATANALGMAPEGALAHLELARHSRVFAEADAFEKHWNEARPHLEKTGDLASLVLLEKLKSNE